MYLLVVACDDCPESSTKPHLYIWAVPESAFIEGQNIQWTASAGNNLADGATFAWAVGGNVPPGLTVQPNGASLDITGACNAPGDYIFALEVSGGGKRASKQVLFRVAPQTGPLAIYEVMLLGAHTHFAYSQDIVATGGTGSGYVWTVAAGALPPGITIGAGPQGGLLSGTPTASGTYTFTLRVDDSGGAFATADFELAVMTHPPSR